jgi:hypothetical protein
MMRTRQFEASLSPAQLKIYKQEFTRKHRVKNLFVGGIIMSGIVGIYLYSMKKTGRDDFTKLD